MLWVLVLLQQPEHVSKLLGRLRLVKNFCACMPMQQHTLYSMKSTRMHFFRGGVNCADMRSSCQYHVVSGRAHAPVPFVRSADYVQGAKDTLAHVHRVLQPHGIDLHSMLQKGAHHRLKIALILPALSGIRPTNTKTAHAAIPIRRDVPRHNLWCAVRLVAFASIKNQQAAAAGDRVYCAFCTSMTQIDCSRQD
jgi:hypothetical protein